MNLKDTGVDIRSNSLRGKSIDFVVTGGIAAIESPRFIRSLRRLGASVRVWMTRSASDFVSKRVFEWASDQEVITDLSGSAEHVSQADAIVVSPCSLNTLSKIKLGIADSAAMTLCQSAMGRIPIILQPAMHDSMDQNPVYRENKSELLSRPKVFEIPARAEESKQKVTEPELAADFVSHQLNFREESVLVVMGPTRSYIDDVRFVSNYSTGRIGSHISNEFFRYGFQVRVVSGPVQVEPLAWIERFSVNTSEEMLKRARSLQREQDFSCQVFAAAVLDFEVSETRRGKISSKESLRIDMKPSAKLLDQLLSDSAVNIAFKLESGLDENQLKERVKSWSEHLEKRVDLVVANHLVDAQSPSHRVFLYDPKSSQFQTLNSQNETSHKLVQHLMASLRML